MLTKDATVIEALSIVLAERPVHSHDDASEQRKHASDLDLKFTKVVPLTSSQIIIKSHTYTQTCTPFRFPKQTMHCSCWSVQVVTEDKLNDIIFSFGQSGFFLEDKRFTVQWPLLMSTVGPYFNQPQNNPNQEAMLEWDLISSYLQLKRTIPV